MSARWAPAGRTPCNPLLLAAGIDRSGEQARHLLSLGFGGVEFGTVTPHEVPHRTPAACALAARLAPFAAQTERPLLGVNLGLMPGEPHPLWDWAEGIRTCAPVADYLALNLSAESARPLLSAEAQPTLWQALTAARQVRDAYAATSGRAPALALKLPLGTERPTTAELAAAAGLDAVIVVLSPPTGIAALRRLHDMLVTRYPQPPALIAVGGLRHAADVTAALGAGACAVQVHTACTELGPACAATLLDPDARACTTPDAPWSIA
jgi:dihydroorotate dehydrogenase